MKEIKISGGNPIRSRLDGNGSPHPAVCVHRSAATSVACFHLARPGCSWLTCITRFGDPARPFLSTDSSEDHMHPKSAAPRGSVSCSIVPSRLHKQRAGNATAQWETAEREGLQRGGRGRETAGGQRFVTVCG